MPDSESTQPITDDFRYRLKGRLDELDWSYADLAEKIGASRSLIEQFTLKCKGAVGSDGARQLIPLIEVVVGWKTPEQSGLPN